MSKKAPIGATRIAPNGYHYTKTRDGWIGTHRLVIEKKLGRKLREGERVTFVDGDRTNRSPDNLELSQSKKGSIDKRIARLEAKIEDLQGELKHLYLEKEREQAS